MTYAASRANTVLPAFFDEALVGVAQLGPDGNWLYLNQQLCELCGYQADELLLLDPAALEHPEETALKELCVCVRAQERVNVSAETRFVRGDGRLLWVHLIASTITPNGPAPSGTLVLVVDMTQRKRREQRLAAEFAVSQVLGEAPVGGYNAGKVIAAICESLHWELGMFWTPDRNESALDREATWIGTSADDIVRFESRDRSRRLKKGEGAAGSCWERGATIMLKNVTTDRHERSREAYDAGLGAALAFPVFTGPRVSGVMEFYSRGAYAQDDLQELASMIDVIAHELSLSMTRHVTEKAARESELRKTAIVDSALDCIVSFDESGTITDFNEAAEITFGYLHTEVIGKPLTETIIPPALRAGHSAAIEHHLRTGETRVLDKQVETTATRSDGSVFPIELTIVRMPLPGPAVFTAFMRDISERNHARAALQESNDRYRRLSELALEGVLLHEAGVLLDANASFLRMFGYELHELKGRYVLDFLPAPESREVVMSHARSGFETAFEIMALRRDGTAFPVELKGRPTTFEGRNVRVATVRDVTERRELEQRAQQLLLEQAARANAEEQHRKMEFLAEASRVLGTSFDYHTTVAQLVRLAIPAFADWCVIDALEDDGKFVCLGYAHIDPEKEKLLATRQHLIDGRVSDNHPVMTVLRTGATQFAAEVPEGLTDTFASDEAHARTLRALTPRSVIIVPLVVGERVFAAMSLVLSQSGRKYDERDVSLAEALGRRAGLAIESARLYQHALQATQARDEMLGVVAHDLRNPLNTIVLGTDMLTELMTGRNTELERRQLDIVQRSAHRMNRMIQDLLDVRRIDSGGLVIDVRPEPVPSLLQDAADMLGPLAAAASIEMKVSGADGLPYVLVDPARVQQVFSNLVGNAIKFTPAQGCVELSAQLVGNEVQFAVIDTGPGISRDQLPHVFRRFFQADKRDRRGIGLGLAIAQGIVEAHGGRIWVESEQGHGSAFRFTVPTVTS